jgi:hypothetical protein
MTTTNTCEVCGRRYTPTHQRQTHWELATRVHVRHGYYGCDTGCDGYWVDAYNATDTLVAQKFLFDHPGHGVTAEEYARSLAGTYVDINQIPLTWVIRKDDIY